MRYLEQLNKKNVNHLFYILGLGGLLLFFAINIIASFAMETSTNDTIKILVDSLGKNIAFIVVIIPLSFLCLGLLIWIKLVHNQSFTGITTGRFKIDWKRIFFMFGLWSTFLVLSVLATYLYDPTSIEIQFEIKKFIPFFIIAIILVPLQTSFEEYFFRGYFMQYLGFITKNKWFPLILTSLLFGLMHVSNPEVAHIGPAIMIFYIGTGLILGIITLMDDGLELALGFHAANNLITALLITSDNSAFQTNSILKDVSSSISINAILVQVFIIYPIILYICYKKYNWTNWREKLFGKVKQIETNEI